jgi:hypothetical protein
MDELDAAKEQLLIHEMSCPTCSHNQRNPRLSESQAARTRERGLRGEHTSQRRWCNSSRCFAASRSINARRNTS